MLSTAPSQGECGGEATFFDELHARKYRLHGEDYEAFCHRFVRGIYPSPQITGYHGILEAMLDRRILFGGRVQAAVGTGLSGRTAMNCFVSQTIHDSIDGIYDAARAAARVFKMGGGIGYDFSTLRPRGASVASAQHKASGPVSFMRVFDASCATMMSAGHRRGAQMGILRIDHPDILEFITAKRDNVSLTNFNISVAVTDEFMSCLKEDKPFSLRFNGEHYKSINPLQLWRILMRSAWDFGEPGVVFIDTINRLNNLSYCEDIAATNPCAEQPLPPYGACLLGSMNLTRYVEKSSFSELHFCADVSWAVRALDSVIDISHYPLPQHEQEMKNKRRIGLGVCGLANAAEMLGYPYGSPPMLRFTHNVLSMLANRAYLASAQLARERGAFPRYDAKAYRDAPFISGLGSHVRRSIAERGLRNSHLVSFAPTGTIAMCAGNVSGGIEPVYAHMQHRRDAGRTISDYAYRVHGIKGRQASECSVEDHLSVLEIAARYSDSGVSKTVNVSSETTTYQEFEDIYVRCYEMGIKACAVFRSDGGREGVMSACTLDPATGQKTCAD
jgi:ribonucleoside-diphosphate reductase alpha chain